MKKLLILAAVLSAAIAPARAVLTALDPAYGATPYTTSAAGDVISFDWSSSGDLYYMTVSPSYTFGGLYRVSNQLTTTAVDGSGEFPGASVISIGSSLYYNTSDSSNTQKIYRFDPSGGSSSLVSTTPNSGLYTHDARLFITGAVGFTTNHLYQSALDASGNLLSNPAIDLGVTAGFSGPITFDLAGNLYYAPGYGNTGIYKWSAGELAAAMANPSLAPLSATGHLWLDYTSLYGTVSGATSMLLDGNGSLLLTLTSFTDPSLLVSFGIDGTGSYNHSTAALLQDTDRIGELRYNDGNLYLSSGSAIYHVVPEPSAVLLLGFGLLLVLGSLRKRFKPGGVSRALAVAALAAAAQPAHAAGPYTPTGDEPGSIAIPADDPRFAGWAASVIDYHPGPVDITVPGGATASFQGDNGLDSVLGPATVAPEGTDEANPFDVVSLGDGGWITLGFAQPITNGDGADFAVFENGFQAIGDQYFLELAHVAVSSDGIHFFTFPSVSLTQTTTQVGGFGTLDPTYIYNLAGRDVASFGTPFDLQELAGIDPLLDINRITQVRITDAVGSILPAYASYDSLGNIINDQWKTNFTNGGFDLDAVGVIHPIPEPAALCWLASGAALLAWFRRGRSRA